MIKRFCDNCGSEISWYDLYYYEELRAVNMVVCATDKRDESIVNKRDLCVGCNPHKPASFNPNR